MQSLCDSIREYGILSPLLARPAGEGYELVSGHRRRAAALKLGIETLPVLVRDLINDEAIILMVDSNIQRENLLPSEKAFAYKMKLEAIKHQGKTTSCKVCTKSRSDEQIATESNVSARTIQNYIRLTYLAKPILNLVDEGRIAFSPAVELSYLTQLEQAELWDIMQSEDCIPSLSQAVRLKKLSWNAELTPEKILEIMSEERPIRKSGFASRSASSGNTFLRATRPIRWKNRSCKCWRLIIRKSSAAGMLADMSHGYIRKK